MWGIDKEAVSGSPLLELEGSWKTERSREMGSPGWCSLFSAPQPGESKKVGVVNKEQKKVLYPHFSA